MAPITRSSHASVAARLAGAKSSRSLAHRPPANSMCHLCEQLAKITEIVDSARLVYDLAGAGAHDNTLSGDRGAGPLGRSDPVVRASHGRPASQTTIDVASLVINITLNTSRRQAKTPIWDLL